jgi:hypothetical protein
LDWSEARQDSKGRLRPKQKSYLLGAKTAGDLPTKSAARTKWAKIRERVMASSSASSNGAQTFMEYAIGTYMKERTAIKNWRPASVAKFTYLISLTASSFGKKQLAAISTAELQSYLNSLAKKAAHHTVNGSLVYIRAIFGFAHEEEVVLKDPSPKARASRDTRAQKAFHADGSDGSSGKAASRTRSDNLEGLYPLRLTGRGSLWSKGG